MSLQDSKVSSQDATDNVFSKRVDSLFSGGKIGSFNIDKLKELLGSRANDILGEKITGQSSDKGISKNTFSLGGVSNSHSLGSNGKVLDKNVNIDKISAAVKVVKSVEAIYVKTISGSNISLDDMLKKNNKQTKNKKLPFVQNLNEESLSKAAVVTTSVDKEILLNNTSIETYIPLIEREDFKTGFDTYLKDLGLDKTTMSANDITYRQSIYSNIYSSPSKFLTKAYTNENSVIIGNSVAEKEKTELKSFNVFEPLKVSTSNKKYVFTKDADTFNELTSVNNIQDKTKYGSTSTLSKTLSTTSEGMKYTKAQEIPNNEFLNYVGYLKDSTQSRTKNDMSNLQSYNSKLELTQTSANNENLNKNTNVATASKINPQAIAAGAGSVSTIIGNAGSIINNFADTSVSYYEEAVTKAQNAAKDTFAIANGITGAISELTGFKNILDPNIEKKVNGFLGQLGLGSPGIGNDTKSYLDSTVRYITVADIDGVKLDNSCFMSFCEKYDFIKEKIPHRYVKFRLNSKHLEKFKLDGKNKKITIMRYYGYRPASQPSTTSVPDTTNYQPFEILKEYEIKSLKQNTKISKENAKEAEGTEKELKTRAEFEGVIIPPTLTKDQKAKNFNGIPANSKISTIIAAAFKTCYEKGKLALSNPVNDLVLDKVIFTPMTFPQVLTKMQKDYKIFEGGFNIFIDGDVYYVLNKEGPNNIKFEDDWTYVFKTNPNLNQNTYTTISPSRKKIIFNIFDGDVTKPSDKSDLKPIEDRYNKGSKTGLTQGTTKDTSSSIVIPVAHDYILQKPESNLKVEDFVIKIRNSFVTFKPGDNVEINYRKTLYKGTVKSWGAEQNTNGRAVIVRVTAKQSTGGGSILDKLAPSNLIEKYQETMSELSSKVDNTISDYTQKGMDYVSNKTGSGNILNVGSMKEAFGAVTSKNKK